MATLSEHYNLIDAAIEAAEEDGFAVKAKSCCCGEGLTIENEATGEVEYLL
jgi:hypothetical protein